MCKEFYPVGLKKIMCLHKLSIHKTLGNTVEHHQNAFQVHVIWETYNIRTTLFAGSIKIDMSLNFKHGV